MMKRKQKQTKKYINLRKTFQTNPAINRIRLASNYLNLIKLSQTYNNKTERKQIEEVKNIILSSKKDNLCANPKIEVNPAPEKSLLKYKYFTQIDMLKKKSVALATKKKNIKKLSLDQVLNSTSPLSTYPHHNYGMGHVAGYGGAGLPQTTTNIIGLSAINKENIKIGQTDTIKIINPNRPAGILSQMSAALSIKDEAQEDIILPVKNSILSNNKKISLHNLEVAQSKNIFYLFNKTNIIKNITTILENSFLKMSSIISKPVFYITPSKVIIQLFFFSFLINKKNIRKNRNRNRNKNKFKNNQNNKDFLNTYFKKLELLCANLSKFINKAIELDLIKLYSSLNDSTILTNVLSRISDINYRPYILLLDKVFYNAKIKNPNKSIPMANSIIPSYITGIKIKLGGRLLKNKIRPKVSSKTTQFGSLTRSSAEMISKGRYTSKNKRGTFSFTATIGYRFY